MADGGGQTLVLCQSSGLVYREVTFGWVDSKGRAYESWGGKKVAESSRMVESQRLLLEYILKQINSAHVDSKPGFYEGKV
jgi:hypothetical protein